jgi:hypothetical protein
VKADSEDWGHTWPQYADEQPLLPTTSAGFDGLVIKNRNGGVGNGFSGNGDSGRANNGNEAATTDAVWLVAWDNSTVNRNPLALATSDDEGGSWQPLGVVEDAAGGSFAYPFLLQSNVDAAATAESTTNRVHLCYSYAFNGTSTIAYARLEVS